MKRYFPYVKPYLPYFILGPILMISEVLGDVWLPKLVSRLINEGAMVGDLSFILKTGLIMVLICIAMALCGMGGSYMAIRAAVGFAGDVRQDLFKKIQTFAFADIDHFSTGSLITRMTNDVTQLQNLITMMLRMMLRSPGMFIGAVIMAMGINRKLATVILCIIPILILFTGIVIKVAFPRFRIMQEKLDTLNSRVQESLTNVRVIKSFVREDHEQKRFRAANDDLTDNAMRAMRIMVLIMPFMTLAISITTLCVVWFSGREIVIGNMLVGDLTAFITYTTQILSSLMMLSMIFLQSSRAMASSRRIAEVMDHPSSLTDLPTADRNLQVKKGKIEFKNVSFRYYQNNPEPVLSDISFTVEPGETLGIIGTTGSGKSSLVHLIPRLYDVTDGEVLVDDVNVRDYTLHNLRSGISMVLQNNTLFSGTIRENLQWGDEDAPDDVLRAAASIAEADGFVMSFSEGYDTELGQGGVNVSGGQKQRLCIARALLRNPKILILDDSTSAVDTATEARIRSAFQNELKDSTKLIIAQRITSVMDADRILILERGRIADLGTHEELLTRCEAYQAIYRSQMEREVKHNG